MCLKRPKRPQKGLNITKNLVHLARPPPPPLRIHFFKKDNIINYFVHPPAGTHPLSLLSPFKDPHSPYPFVWWINPFFLRGHSLIYDYSLWYFCQISSFPYLVLYFWTKYFHSYYDKLIHKNICSSVFPSRSCNPAEFWSGLNWRLLVRD